MSSDKLQRALQKLVDSGQDFVPFEPAPPKGGRPGTRSVGRPGSLGGAGGAGGAGFDEEDYLEREYWDAIELESSDGIFVLEVEPIKSILLSSGYRATFDEPREPEEVEE